MLVLVLGYVGFWLALSFLIGFGFAIALSPGSEKKPGDEDMTKAGFLIGAVTSLAITILIVSCRIIF